MVDQTRFDRLDKLARLAKNSEQHAVRELERHKSQLEAIRNTVSDLKKYRMEYLQRYHEESITGINIDKLKNYQDFLGNLDIAIDRHQDMLDAEEIQYSQAKHLWREKANKLNGLNKMITNESLRIKRKVIRLEQKETDQLSRVKK